MLGATHVCLGAGVGSLLENKGAAFGAGVLSHWLADSLPHRDCTPAVEAPLALGALAGIALWKGLDSPEFWGAVGGLAPDFEHALIAAGLLPPGSEIFPTHFADGKWHGDESGTERWSQLALMIASILLIALRDRE